MFKKFYFIAVLAILATTSYNAYAQKTDDTEFHQAAEGVMQFHGVAGAGKELLGTGLVAHLSGHTSLGFRGMLSLSDSGDYAFQVLWRYFFTEGHRHLFLEPTLTANLNAFNNLIISGGLSWGFMASLSKDISLGGTAGFEFSGDKELIVGHASLGSIAMTPVGRMFLSFDF